LRFVSLEPLGVTATTASSNSETTGSSLLFFSADFPAGVCFGPAGELAPSALQSMEEKKYTRVDKNLSSSPHLNGTIITCNHTSKLNTLSIVHEKELVGVRVRVPKLQSVLHDHCDSHSLIRDSNKNTDRAHENAISIEKRQRDFDRFHQPNSPLRIKKNF